MLKKLLGFAVLAIVAFFLFNLAVSLLGFAMGLAWKLIQFALIGVVIYWVLKLVAPSTARKVEEVIRG